MNNNYKRIIFVRHGESSENIAMHNGKSYDKNNIVLTDKGKKQAKLTGHYLYDIFGKFDQVYSSPATRCVQTGNIINKQIKYKNKLIIDNLLVEIGFDSNKLDGLSFNEQKEVFDNIKLTLPKDKLFNGINTYDQFKNKLNETINPYDKLKMYQILNQIDNTYLEIKPNTNQVKNNYKKFLKNLKKSKANNILVISHGRCISLLQKLLCNVDTNNMNLYFEPNFKEVSNKLGNCCISCLELNNNKYSLVSPANTNHLKNKII